MSDSGNVNVGDDAKVYGTVVGQNTGTINTTVNIGGFCRSCTVSRARGSSAL